MAKIFFSKFFKKYHFPSRYVRTFWYVLVGLAERASGHLHHVRPPPAQQGIVVSRRVPGNRGIIREPLEKPAQPSLEAVKWLQGWCIRRQYVPQLSCSYTKRTIVVSSNWQLDFVVNWWYNGFETKSRMWLELHVDVVWRKSIYNFPYLNNAISLSSPLKWHDLEFFEPVPIVHMLET